MHQKIAKKWIAALRSRKYQQGRAQLRTSSNEFCCLGILCNLHAQAHPAFAKLQVNPKRYGGSFELLCPEVQHWAGMRSSSGVPGRAEHSIANSAIQVAGRPFRSLAEANDQGCTFDEIADAVELNWDRL